MHPLNKMMGDIAKQYKFSTMNRSSSQKTIGMNTTASQTELTKINRLLSSAEAEGNILPQHTEHSLRYHMLGHKSLNKLKEI